MNPELGILGIGDRDLGNYVGGTIFDLSTVRVMSLVIVIMIVIRGMAPDKAAASYM